MKNQGINRISILIEFLHVFLYTLLISRKEKENLVIELTQEGKTTREIAKAVHISLKDIGKILRKVCGVDESPAEKAKEEMRK
jgi:transposase